MAPVMRWDLTSVLLALQILKVVSCSTLPYTHLPEQAPSRPSESKALHPQSRSDSIFRNHIFSRAHDASVYQTHTKHTQHQDLQASRNIFKSDVLNYFHLLNYKLKRKRMKSWRSRQNLQEDVANDISATNNQRTSSFFHSVQRKNNKLTEENFIQNLISKSKEFYFNLNKSEEQTKLTSNNKKSNIINEQSIFNSKSSVDDLHSLTKHGVRVKRQSGSGGLTLADFFKDSSEKSLPPTDNTGSLPKVNELKLFYIDKSGTFLRISGEGEIHAVDKSHLDVFCVVHVKAVDLTEKKKVIHKLQGEWTQFYIAMDSDSHLYATLIDIRTSYSMKKTAGSSTCLKLASLKQDVASVSRANLRNICKTLEANANDPNTDFVHKYLSTSHDAYKSRHGSYIAFEDGKPLNKRVRSNKNTRAHFLPRNPDKYDKTLLEKVKGDKPTFRITTTTVLPTTTSSTTGLTTTNSQDTTTLRTSTRTTSLSIVTSSERESDASRQQCKHKKKKTRRKRKGCKLQKNRNKKRCKRKRKKQKQQRRRDKTPKRKHRCHKKHKKSYQKQRKVRSIYLNSSKNLSSLKGASTSTINGVDFETEMKNAKPSSLTSNSGFQLKFLSKNQPT